MEEKTTAASETGTSPPTASTRGTLTNETMGGLRWTYLATAVTAVMQLGFTSLMSRLLPPSAFGLVAMALLVLTLAQHFSKMGVGQAVIQKSRLNDTDVRAAFTSSIVLGCLASALIWFASPLVGSLFGEPSVTPVVRVMGLGMLVTGTGITAESLLRRRLQFRALAYRDMTSYAIGYLGVGLPLAWSGAGVWSLVAASLTQSAVRSLICYVAVRHSVRPVVRWYAYRPLMRFGAQVSLIGILEYVGEHVDTLIVGRYATTALLGQYNRAFVLTNLPLYHLMTGLSKVLFPGFSRIQHDRERVKGAYLSALGLFAAGFLPLAAGMGAAGRELVLVVLGDQWQTAAAILPLVALAASLRVLIHLSGVVLEALAELPRKLVLQSGYLVILLALLALAIGEELWAYAAAFAAGQLCLSAGYMVLMGKVLPVSWGELMAVIGRGVIGAMFTAGAIIAVRSGGLALELPAVALLGAEMAAGALSLAALLRSRLYRPIARDLFSRLQHAGLGPQSGLAYRSAAFLLRPAA